jgi:ABC-type multidrug transport system fused ATPase/permease subunit
MIYFIQNLPLKRRLSQEMVKSDKPQKLKKLKACLEIFNDKTLWFASIYFIVISLSFYQEGFVAILMIDFFVRFKISKKVTEIVTRPFIQLLLIVLVSVQIAFVFTYYLYFLGDELNCNSAPTCIQRTYF